MTDEKYCMTEISKEFTEELLEFLKLETYEVYDKEYWKRVDLLIIEENERYEELCRNMQIDPISGKSTMSWEERNKMFNF